MLTFVLGIAASLIAWLVTVAVLRPKLSFHKDLVPFDSGTVDGSWFYIYVRNRRPWKAVDIAVSARLRVQGLYPEHPRRWGTFELSLDDERVPILIGTATSQRANAGRLRTLISGSARQGFRVYMPAIPDRLRRLAPQLQSSGRIELEDLLGLGSRAQLYFTAFATDGFSGNRQAFESRRFGLADLPDLSGAETVSDVDGSHASVAA